MQQPPNPEQSQPPYYQQPTQSPYNGPQTPVPPPPYQHSSYPPQQPPMQAKKSKTWIWILALVFVFFVGRASVTTTSSDTATPTNTTQANTTTNQQPAAQPTEAPTKPQKPLVWTTTQTFQGNGGKKTGTFVVPGDWKIKWTCNPASFGGANYNMIIGVYNSDGSIADFGAVNSTCKNGSVSGESEEHQGGTVFLDVTSEGDWSIQIQELR